MASTSSLASASPKKLLLAVEVNGAPIGKIGEFTLRSGVLLATSQELTELGLRVSAAEARGSLVSLSALPGLTWTINEATQTVMISAADTRRVPTRLSSPTSPPDVDEIQSGTGATLNYDITQTVAGQASRTSGLLDLRLFSPYGIASTAVLASAGERLGTRRGVIRLDTMYSYSDPDRLLQYRMGDFISGSLSWTRAVRFGGIQVTSDYSMRPDVVTFPLPTLNGSASAASTIDVLVNGGRLLSRDVPSGPFVIPQIPVIDGAGTISLAVTDAAGRQVITAVPFYTSAMLMAAGLRTFSAQVGAIRRNFGVRSNDYRELAASATYRRGLTDWLTLEGDLEGTGRVTTTGSGLVVKLGNLGIANAAIAISRGSAGNGSQATLGLQRASRVFSAGISVTKSSRAFANLATVGGEPPVRMQIAGSAAVSLGDAGSIGAGYSQISRRASRLQDVSGDGFPRGSDDRQSPLLRSPERFKLGSLSYNFQSRGISTNIYAYRNLTDKKDSGITIGATIPFGRRASASASIGVAGGRANAQVQALQSASAPGEWGYQVSVRQGPGTQGFAAIEHQTAGTLLRAGVDYSAGKTAVRFNATGSLSLIDGALFAGSLIHDSFAIVDTNGLSNVRVMSENRVIGRTDSGGRLFVPRLHAFDINQLAIEPDDIPIDSSIADTTARVRPQERSGVVVRFPVRASRGALVRLVDENGGAVPLGSRALMHDVAYPIGYDGAVYLEGLDMMNDLLVEREDGSRCAASFAYTPNSGKIPTIGPSICRPLP